MCSGHRAFKAKAGTVPGKLGQVSHPTCLKTPQLVVGRAGVPRASRLLSYKSKPQKGFHSSHTLTLRDFPSYARNRSQQEHRAAPGELAKATCYLAFLLY